MSDRKALTIQNLTKIYSAGWKRESVKAVDDLSLSIDKGSVVGLIGPNGAGKSTAIYCILGLLIPDAGSIQIFGHPPESKQARSRLGFQSEIFHTYDYLKPKDTLKLYGQLSRLSEAELERRITPQLERLGLMHAQNRKVGSFSKGMKQRLGIAQALIHDPDLLILDEPFTGLDPQGRKEIGDIVFEEKRKGKTVFFSSHILSDIERLCDQVIMIRKGQVVLSGDLEDITTTEGRWSITVKGWSKVSGSPLDDWELSINHSQTTTEIICSGEQKDELLSKLLQLPVDIIGMRAHTQTLEELYMELDNQKE